MEVVGGEKPLGDFTLNTKDFKCQSAWEWLFLTFYPFVFLKSQSESKEKYYNREVEKY